MMNVLNAKSERNLAMMDFDEGHLPEAESRLSELITSIGATDSPHLKDELCACYLDRSTVREFANRWQEALDDLSACEALAKTLKVFARSANLQRVYVSRAKLLARPITPFYDLQKAHTALEESRKLGFDDWIADEVEGDIAFRTSHWKEAAEFYVGLAQTLTNEGWQRGAMSCHLRAGLAFLGMDEWQQAQSEITLAEEFFQQYGPPDQLAATQMAQARLYSATGKHDEAWELANFALQGLEGLIRCFRGLFEQQRFVLDKIEKYEQAFVIGLAKGGKEGVLRAWTIAERAKSFYLCQLVANADVQLFDGIDPGQAAQLRELDLQLDLCESSYDRLTKSQGSHAERQAELAEQLQQLSTQKQTLLAKMMQANPRWAALRSPPALVLGDEFARLDPSWTLLSYFFYPKADGAILYIFYTGPGREPCYLQTDWSREELEQLDRSRETLRGKVPAFESLFPTALIPKVLPRMLIESLEPGRRILISPHDRLRAIPLHALAVGAGERLIQRCPVQYIPTLALLPLRKQHTTDQPTSVLLMGCAQDDFLDPPLKEVSKEIQVLHNVWQVKRPGQVQQRLLEQTDSPAEVGLSLETWGRFEFVHIACHGVFPEDQPLNAALRLGKDAVRASEFFHVRLNAALVSLSACALGRQTRQDAGIDLRGDEWIGLYLPMFYAGAQTLLVSLWDANTQTAVPFMNALHSALSEDLSPVQAFQEAQQCVERKPAPLWANWYLVGFPD